MFMQIVLILKWKETAIQQLQRLDKKTTPSIIIWIQQLRCGHIRYLYFFINMVNAQEHIEQHLLNTGHDVQYRRFFHFLLLQIISMLFFVVSYTWTDHLR